MRHEERILAGSAVALRPAYKLSTSFAHQGGSVHGGSGRLNYFRQGTALAVPKSRCPQRFQPLWRSECTVELAPSETEGAPALKSTRHWVPSSFRPNSLKTKKSGPTYSTLKRGVSIHPYLPQLGNFESHPCSTNRRCAGKLLSIPKEMNRSCCA